MIEHNLKSPNLAETGFSKHIHQDQLVNEQYYTMIIDNPEYRRFCVHVLSRFDELLNYFNIEAPKAFKGNELELFIALNEKANLQAREVHK